MKSKWADDEQDRAAAARRKEEREEKKRAKAEKQRRVEEARAQTAQAAAATRQDTTAQGPPRKRRRLSSDDTPPSNPVDGPAPLLRFKAGTWAPSRSITDFEILNPIEEGTYGYVSRARDKATGDVVALKKMKVPPRSDRSGVSVTTLREIQTLQRAAPHRNVILLREVIVDDSATATNAPPATTIPDVYLVMDFAAHDLKSLLEDMPAPFTPSETKALMAQLASALSHLHAHWIIHRDLKTSNILLTGAATVKVADFGMARFTSADPAPRDLTQLVVTLWYRAPELLLGARDYGFAIDLWSLGCVFGELLGREPLLPGRREVDQLSKIFDLCGVPTDETWPGFRRLPNARTLKLPSRGADKGAEKGNLAGRFTTQQLAKGGQRLLWRLLSLDPLERPSADEVLEHRYFDEDPRPKREDMFPSFPSKAGLERRRRKATPEAPVRGTHSKQATDFSSLFT